MNKTAYFDLDGTLVGTSLIEPTAYYLLNQLPPFKRCDGLEGPYGYLRMAFAECKSSDVQ